MPYVTLISVPSRARSQRFSGALDVRGPAAPGHLSVVHLLFFQSNPGFDGRPLPAPICALLPEPPTLVHADLCSRRGFCSSVANPQRTLT